MLFSFLWNSLRICSVSPPCPEHTNIAIHAHPPPLNSARLPVTDGTLHISTSQIELERASHDSQSSQTYAESPRSIKFPHITSQLNEFSTSEQDFLLTYTSYHSPLLDSIRHSEFKRLDQITYLDYTGAALYPESLVSDSHNFLTTAVLGNPHSTNPSSKLTSYYTSKARNSVLQFFNADPNIYVVVWTANASTAMRIVGEGYPWSSHSRLFLGQDCHNSLNGLRTFARKNAAAVDYYTLSPSGPWSEKWAILQRISDLRPSSSDTHPGIFCLTGQSNVTGYKAPLFLLQHAASQGFHTFLDAAALAPSTSISLSGSDLNNCVDAMAISIYKIIGFPTGLGALVVKKSFLQKLKKPWFSGGTVDVVQVPGEAYTLEHGPERFEDGTINYLSMLTIPRGLSLISVLLPVLHPRLASLVHWTMGALSGIRHRSTQKSLCHIRSPSPALSLSEISQSYGALITFEVADASGHFVSCEAIEYGAGKAAGICLRSGCMCNPGGTSRLAGMTYMMNGVSSGDTKDDLEARFGIRSRGVIRASFGIASNFSDAWNLVAYMRSLAEPENLRRLLDDWTYQKLSGH